MTVVIDQSRCDQHPVELRRTCGRIDREITRRLFWRCGASIAYTFDVIGPWAFAVVQYGRLSARLVPRCLASGEATEPVRSASDSGCQ